MPLIWLLACPNPRTTTSAEVSLSAERIEILELDTSRNAFREGTVDIGNTGDSTLWVWLAGVQDAPSFSADAGGVERGIEPGESRTLGLRYEPLEVGWEQGSVVLTTSDALRPSVAVAVFGSTLGTRAELHPSDRHLGSMGRGCSAEIALEVRNPTLNQLELDGFELSDGSYSVDGDLPAVIEAGTSAGFTLRFQATEEIGYHETRVSVVGNAANAGEFLGLFGAEVTGARCDPDTGGDTG